MRRNPVLWLVVVCSALVPEALGQANAQADEGRDSAADPSACAPPLDYAVPDGVSASDWASVCAAYEANRHAAFAVDGGYRARNPGQEWSTRFDGRGFSTEPEAGGWIWGLELQRFGFAGQERSVAGPPRVTAAGQRVAYDWDDTLQEWYVNDTRGLEHGFSVHQRPPQDQGNESLLTFALAVRGGLCGEVDADGRGVRFVDADGATVLTYTGLTVFDADGRELPASLQRDGEGLQLSVDERGARYPLTIDPIAQQAYLKASNSGGADLFGSAVAISGNTLVVSAPFEDSNATGVDGNQVNDSAEDAGAAYVFVRSGTSWSQQAYLKASNTDSSQPEDLFGFSVALSGDTLVVGAYNEDSNATGVNGNQSNNLSENSGAAYVFVRSGTTWSQQAYLKASNTGTTDSFGWSVAASGDTVVVGAISEGSNATGVNGNQNNNLADGSGAAYVFVRSGTVWSQQAYLKASNTELSDAFGKSVAISGNTVVVGAQSEDSNATGVNGNQADNSASLAGAAYVFVRSGTTWSQQAYLKASNTAASDFFGVSVAVSGDTVVVGADGEDSNATGVNGSQSDNSAALAGAAYVFVRSGTVWSQQAYLKASNTAASDRFSTSLAVSGDTVVVGATSEDSNATGVNGNQADNSASSAGAAYVFVRGGTSWSQQAYLKASNTEGGDIFGSWVAVSGDTVVAGATGDDSNATGVNGNQSNNDLPGAGATYVFDLGIWTDLGGGTSGVAGLPVLEMSGALTPSSLVTLDLVDGAPSAVAIIFISFTSTPASFLGGTLHALPIAELVVVGTDGAGEIHGSAFFPGAASGQGLWFQVGLYDASVPIYGASLSNGVKGTVP